MDAMEAKGHAKEEMQLAGLIHNREGHQYDVFRNRVMFPIIDQYGGTLGFGRGQWERAAQVSEHPGHPPLQQAQRRVRHQFSAHHAGP